MITRTTLYIFFLAVFFVSVETVAATVPDGRIIVRIDDGTTSHCINSTTERITMHMRRLIINKDVGVFSEDKTAAILVNTLISGEEAGVTPKKVSFPRMYTVNVVPYTSGYTSLPVEEKLFSRFPLTNSGNSYDTAEIEFTVLAKKGRAPFGIALSALADISKNLPAPINPFSQGFKYFSDYANKVIEGSLADEDNLAHSSKEGKISLSFSSTSTCTGDQESTGTLAVVSGADGEETEGFVNIKKDYCWKAEFRPVFALKFSRKKPEVSCSEMEEINFHRLNNPYIAFYLNAEPINLTSSLNGYAKTVALPAMHNSATVTKVSYAEIEGSLKSAYADGFAKTTPTGAYMHTIKNVSGKVTDVLGDPVFFSKSSKIKASKEDNTVTLWTTAFDSVAIDLAESLKRCATHGISAHDCL